MSHDRRMFACDVRLPFRPGNLSQASGRGPASDANCRPVVNETPVFTFAISSLAFVTVSICQSGATKYRPADSAGNPYLTVKLRFVSI